MDDLISRKGVFIPDITVEMFRNASLESVEELMVSGEMKDIVLPSAQPERKKGEWEIYVISMLDGEGCRCSECGFEGAPYWDFCPECGADMRGEQDV